MGWAVIKGKYTQGVVELLEKVAEQDNIFDQLSAIIAGQIPYQSPEEFERAMRGDH